MSRAVLPLRTQPWQEEGSRDTEDFYLLGIPSHGEVDAACLCLAHTEGEKLHLWEERKGVNGMHVRLMKSGLTCDDTLRAEPWPWCYLT